MMHFTNRTVNDGLLESMYKYMTTPHSFVFIFNYSVYILLRERETDIQTDRQTENGRDGQIDA